MQSDIYSHAVGVERTNTGRKLVVSRVVDATADEAWHLLTTTSEWPRWGPSVAAVDCDAVRVSQGTTGRVKLTGVGVWVPFEVDSYADEGSAREWSWRVARLPATGHRVEELGDQCRVSFEIPLLAGFYVPVCRRALDAIAESLERGMGR